MTKTIVTPNAALRSVLIVALLLEAFKLVVPMSVLASTKHSKRNAKPELSFLGGMGHAPEIKKKDEN